MAQSLSKVYTHIIFSTKHRQKLIDDSIKTKSNSYANFYWQNGYGIFSVNPSEIDVVINYIKNNEI